MLVLIKGLAVAVVAGCVLGAVSSCMKPEDALEPAQPRILSRWVVAVVGDAEAAWQAQLGPLRGAAEQLQDEVARTSPLEAYAADWSIGRYNIRPSTARSAIDWAFAQSIAGDYGYTGRPTDEDVVRRIMDDERSGTLVQLILARLRAEHPSLSMFDWETIEAVDQYIAKLYSGYLGAGGAWEAWQANLLPGDEAKQRLGCTEEGTWCALVERHRPPAGN